jgi:hypothetical protein
MNVRPGDAQPAMQDTVWGRRVQIFWNEKAIVENYLESRGHIVVFLPKFHCELNEYGDKQKCTHAHAPTLPMPDHQPGFGLCQYRSDQKVFQKSERAYLEWEKARQEVEQAAAGFVLNTVFDTLQILYFVQD